MIRCRRGIAIATVALGATACGGPKLFADYREGAGTELFFRFERYLLIEATARALPTEEVRRFTVPPEGTKLYALYFDQTPKELGVVPGALSNPRDGRPLPAPASAYELEPGVDEDWIPRSGVPQQLGAWRIPYGDCAKFLTTTLVVPFGRRERELPKVLLPTETGMLLVNDLRDTFHLDVRGPTRLEDTPYEVGAVAEDGRVWLASRTELFSALATEAGFTDVVMTATLAGARPSAIYARGGEVLVADIDGGVYALEAGRLRSQVELGDTVTSLARLPSGVLVARVGGDLVFWEVATATAVVRSEIGPMLYDAAGRLFVARNDALLIHVGGRDFRVFRQGNGQDRITDLVDFDGGVVYALASGAVGEIRDARLCPPVRTGPVGRRFWLAANESAVFGGFLPNASPRLGVFHMEVVSR